MPTGQLVSLIILVVFIFGAFYARHIILQKVSGHSNTRVRFRNRNITMLDRFAVSKDKSFCLVEGAGKVYLVAMTNHMITLLDTYEAAEFIESAVQPRDNAKIPVNNSFKGRMTRSLASFMAKRMGRTIEFDDSAETSGSSFAETMKSATEKDSEAECVSSELNPSDDSEDRA